jgi:hypothetical protein
MMQRAFVRLVAAGALLGGIFALPAASLAGDSIRLGAGVYGVYGLPVAQDNVGSGPLYGLKARADFAGPFGAELSYTSFPSADVKFNSQIGEQTTPGYSQSVTAFDLIFETTGVAGFGVYFLGGVGTYTLKKDYADDITGIGYNGGLGLEFRSNMGLSIDVCGRVHVKRYDDGGSHKFAALQAGVNYYFLR